MIEAQLPVNPAGPCQPECAGKELENGLLGDWSLDLGSDTSELKAKAGVTQARRPLNQSQYIISLSLPLNQFACPNLLYYT